ncbi:glycoside hydrolase family 3 N-terminal domain-containing protein [Botrimarina colliarenosi]|uniref:glycoside hydrolase family 3 N-terminal domain-containing protein n=1 Tax=Botrimarina colliarenosi TaxID=2528001 RepID=UPI0018D48438|nr:glycoside hydrolase family 3 N-terminal domain-containing protein [Botrimarina colliarenosi]
MGIVLALGWYTAIASGEDAAAINPEVETTEGETADPLIEPEALPAVSMDLTSGTVDKIAQRVLAEMSLREKIGQLCQVAVFGADLPEETVKDLRAGRIGSLFYTGSPEQTRRAKRIAIEESRLGLPLLTPRDVIHGFEMVFPIPLGQAASWDPDLIKAAASIAADEASAKGVNWTFAPMIDVGRDARWGRVAESAGEDPVLGSAVAAAMIEGYQQPAEGSDGATVYEGIAACAKHFAGYGLTEGGRDYNRAEVSISELNNVILPPFHTAVDVGCATFMTGFSTVNGVPATGHYQLITETLKEGWGFDGLVVSDWGSVVEMIDHGYAADHREAARLAFTAGLDMEMATTTYRENLVDLIESGAVSTAALDDAVLRVLRVKLRFAMPRDEQPRPAGSQASPRETARQLARESCVLLKNEAQTLPLTPSELKRVAVIGPLADAARDQLGCWMLDGNPDEAVTVLSALKQALGPEIEVAYSAGAASSIDESDAGIEAARDAAAEADVAVVCVGEGWNLSGEARSRANLRLPGSQRELVRAVEQTGTPVVLVVLAGRPLTIGDETAVADAVLYAWHPGTMGGPAIADLLLGVESPSGKLPVTFPKQVGQSPLYYNHPSTGRPALPETRALLGSGRDDFPELQKYRSHYLDVDPFPLYPFGFGLSYTTFSYGAVELSTPSLRPGQTVGVRVSLTNTGSVVAEEVAQLYVQDVTASIVRPVRELKAFRRGRLEPGESETLEFALSTDDLAYYDNDGTLVLEPGEFRLGVGGNSSVPLDATLQLTESASTAEAPTRRPSSR